MDKQVDGVFVARLRPSDHTVWYKFVVDGLWKHDDTKPTEKDKGKRGTVNVTEVMDSHDYHL
jgi:hypothetical protein